MILPTKHLPPSRSLIGIGAEIIAAIAEPRAVSEVWERVREARSRSAAATPISYDEFVQSLTFLYAVSALNLVDGLISRAEVRNDPVH
ncbi:ABC-three component system middle component 6 [Kaistia defluvii]|uniref:ABC-three component system middle component 6 n=1 Tax=Kaistia defluvii TaxID=410841 RepID=UPI0033986E16